MAAVEAVGDASFCGAELRRLAGSVGSDAEPRSEERRRRGAASLMASCYYFCKNALGLFTAALERHAVNSACGDVLPCGSMPETEIAGMMWSTEFDEDFDFHEQLRGFGWRWDVTKWTTDDGREHVFDHHVPELIAELKRLRVSAAQVAAIVDIFFSNGGEESAPGFGRAYTSRLGIMIKTLGQNPSRAEILNRRGRAPSATSRPPRRDQRPSSGGHHST